jgi:hypothetical protein
MRHPGGVSDEDATLIIEAPFDIRVDLHRIRELLEEDDGESRDEEEEP